MTEATRLLSLTTGGESHPPFLPARPEPVDDVLVETVARAVIDTMRAERLRSRIVVRSERRLLFLQQDDIDWIEAAGNYVRLHVRGGDSYVIRQSMKNMEARLDGSRFVRIHRSAIVNIDRVHELQPWLHGEYVVLLDDGTRLAASRVFSDRLDALIG